MINNGYTIRRDAIIAGRLYKEQDNGYLYFSRGIGDTSEVQLLFFASSLTMEHSTIKEPLIILDDSLLKDVGSANELFYELDKALTKRYKDE